MWFIWRCGSIYYYLVLVESVCVCVCVCVCVHNYHHDTKVNPEAVTAVIEPLMMGGKTPETC